MIAAKRTAGKKIRPKKSGQGGGKKAKRPIEHVVIIVKENHGFDNYFGTFPGANGAKKAVRAVARRQSARSSTW